MPNKINFKQLIVVTLISTYVTLFLYDKISPPNLQAKAPIERKKAEFIGTARETTDIYRIVDDDYRVVCYVANAYADRGTSISCIKQ